MNITVIRCGIPSKCEFCLSILFFSLIRPDYNDGLWFFLQRVSIQPSCGKAILPWSSSVAFCVHHNFKYLRSLTKWPTGRVCQYDSSFPVLSRHSYLYIAVLDATTRPLCRWSTSTPSCTAYHTKHPLCRQVCTQHPHLRPDNHSGTLRRRRSCCLHRELKKTFNIFILF